jgi:hypothetical protein
VRQEHEKHGNTVTAASAGSKQSVRHVCYALDNSTIVCESIKTHTSELICHQTQHKPCKIKSERASKVHNTAGKMFKVKAQVSI